MFNAAKQLFWLNSKVAFLKSAQNEAGIGPYFQRCAVNLSRGHLFFCHFWTLRKAQDSVPCCTMLHDLCAMINRHFLLLVCCEDVDVYSKIVTGVFVLQNCVTCPGFSKPRPRIDFRGQRYPRRNVNQEQGFLLLDDRGFALQDCVWWVRTPEFCDVPRVCKTPSPKGFSGTKESPK